MNRVCPDCADFFEMPDGTRIPAFPNHEKCWADVRDPEAPGGGWVCQCPCRTQPRRPSRSLWVPGSRPARVEDPGPPPSGWTDEVELGVPTVTVGPAPEEEARHG